MYQTVAPQDLLVECETSSEVMDTKFTEESQEEIAKYDTPMQTVKQQKSTVPESKRVRYVETPKTKIIQPQAKRQIITTPKKKPFRL